MESNELVLKLDHAALEQPLLDYVHEEEHRGKRIARLDKAIDEALERAPPSMSAAIEALQALRGWPRSRPSRSPSRSAPSGASNAPPS
jgi:hypothetical protein